jgi:hypothetical protein
MAWLRAMKALPCFFDAGIALESSNATDFAPSNR